MSEQKLQIEKNFMGGEFVRTEAVANRGKTYEVIFSVANKELVVGCVSVKLSATRKRCVWRPSMKKPMGISAACAVRAVQKKHGIELAMIEAHLNGECLGARP